MKAALPKILLTLLVIAVLFGVMAWLEHSEWGNHNHD